MNRQEFFKKLVDIVPAEEVSRIAEAYWLAKETHRGQSRDSGERYFEHCRRVACILMEYGPTSVDEIVVALLHDCVEDGFIPEGLFRKLFGDSVADAVEVLSKATPLFDETTASIREKVKKEDRGYYEVITKAPVWIRRIKLADRLDNLNSMQSWPQERQQRYVIETEKYILSIAEVTDNRLFGELKKTREGIGDPWTYKASCVIRIAP